jgi:hypothetical protein
MKESSPCLAKNAALRKTKGKEFEDPAIRYKATYGRDRSCLTRPPCAHLAARRTRAQVVYEIEGDADGKMGKKPRILRLIGAKTR